MVGTLTRWLVRERNLVAVLLCFVALALVYNGLRNESNARFDQACTTWEQDNYDQVRRLSDTYKFLDQLRPHEYTSTLTKFAITNLPRTVAEARADDAPPKCDEPGFGRPEPDPKVPSPSPELVAKIKRIAAANARAR